MKNNPNRFWLVVIFLGWSFDFLFWKKPMPGINFFLYVALCLGTGIFLLKQDGLRLSPRSRLLLFPIAFLSAVTFFRQEPMTVFLSVAMTLFLMGIFAITYLGGQWTKFGLLDYFLGYMGLLGSMIARPIGFIAETKTEQSSPSEKRNNHLWSVLRGIVIALPIIAVFASLLSSADPIFAKRFETFIDLFRIENLPEYIFRLVYILIFAYALAGTFLHAAQKSGDEYQEKPRFAAFLGFTESSIVLGSVVILFLAFVIIQFQYFFGGNANINIEGYTYSEYARKGFGELVMVAFFSLLLLLVLGAISRRETDIQRKTFSSLGVALVVLISVMLISAYQRLVLYELAYGFSRLRTYTHVFMIWLGLLLIVVVALELRKQDRAIGLAMVLAALGFAISLGVMNVDGFIVRQNVKREIQRGEDKQLTQGSRPDLDAQYFLDLSDDAVPELVNGFNNSSLPTNIHEKLGAALACKLYDRKDAKDRPWQSFNLSYWKADKGLVALSKELETYKVIDTAWPVKFSTPSGDEFSCWGYYYD